MLDLQKHDIMLKQILKDIFKDNILQKQVAFKGGTCLYLFYNLKRFSTDLDFNLVSRDFDPKNITKIVKKYISIEDFRSKYNTWFWIGSCEKGLQKVKVEISKRDYPDEYIVRDFLGISILTMKPEYMFAHKLCAIMERRRLQNRDLFDSWFMFDRQWEPNENIIKIRTEKTVEKYYKILIEYISKNVDKNRILDGLGEVLDEKQKVWVKSNLIEELLFQLKVRSDR